MHEWMSDNGLTPHLVIDADAEGVDVPRDYVADGKIVLNASWQATEGLTLGNDAVSFTARFGGRPVQVLLPVDAILGIYARETGQGMIFAEEGPEPGPDDEGPDDGGSSGRRPHLKVVK
jgi:stringent starvation protein B